MTLSDEQAFWEAVEGIRAREPGYAREAYGFLVGALNASVQALPPERLADPARRHLSGRELVAGMVRVARGEFGALAPMVFREWGVTSSEDVGRMVFQLVEDRQLSARPEDTMDDYRGGPALLEQLAADPGARPSQPHPAPGERPGPRP